MKHVTVQNQFVMPRTETAGTRRLDVLGRTGDRQPLVVGGNRNQASRRCIRTDGHRFRLVWVPKHYAGPETRIFGWVVSALEAFTATVTRPHSDVVDVSSLQPGARPAGLTASPRRRASPTLRRVLKLLESLLSTSAGATVAAAPGWEEHLGDLGAETTGSHIISSDAQLVAPAPSEPRNASRANSDASHLTTVHARKRGPASHLGLPVGTAFDAPRTNALLAGRGTRKRAPHHRVWKQHIRHFPLINPPPVSGQAKLLGTCDLDMHRISAAHETRRDDDPPRSANTCGGAQ